MKTLIPHFACCILAVSAFATSVVQVDQSLEEAVRQTDHVIVGKVVEVSMRDKNGRQVKNPHARTEPQSGNIITIRVALASGGVLKTTAKDFPMTVSYDLWPSLVLDLRSMKELVGRSFIILLDGDRLQPHREAPFDFMWPPDLRQRVMDVIAADKKASVLN